MKEIIVPSLGESVTEAIVSKWLFQPGDFVETGQILLELETDKVNLEVTAEHNGVIENIIVNDGANVEVGAVLGIINTEAKQDQKASEGKPTSESDTESQPLIAIQSPAAAKILREIDAENVSVIHGSGKGGRITKKDALMVGGESIVGQIGNNQVLNQATTETQKTNPKNLVAANDLDKSSIVPNNEGDRIGDSERRVPMTKLRQTIARRLKEAQNTAALLTTFNEVDMSVIIKLRQEYQEKFQKRHGTKLGFMSFFVRAATKALAELPIINATVDGNDIVYKDEYHIGVAVGTEKGLVVPVLKNADQMSLAEIESEISKLATKAREGKLAMSDLNGGTFSITNGGIYGSMLSTPIVNPPQSAILAMHNITPRPIVIGNDIVARPMMYIALSYDHRIIDGKEAVQFLVRIKEYVENPERLLLDV